MGVTLPTRSGYMQMVSTVQLYSWHFIGSVVTLESRLPWQAVISLLANL